MLCLLDGVNEDSDVGDEDRGEILSGVVVVDRVTVSAWERETKWPWTLG